MTTTRTAAAVLKSWPYVLSLAVFCVFWGNVAQAQHSPANNCGDFFHYEFWGNQVIGRVKTPQPGLNSVHWKLFFAARGLEGSTMVSAMNLYPNDDKAKQNILNGNHIEAYVSFSNYNDLLPKIVEVEFNGKRLCSGSTYDPPSSTMTREITLSVPQRNFQPKYEPAYIPPPPTRPPTVRPKPRPTAPPPTQRVTTPPKSKDCQFAHNPFLPCDSRPTEAPKNTFIQAASFQCGIEGPGPLQFFGTQIIHGQFPWMSALYIDQDPDPNVTDLSYSCVAAIISARTLITAAHCIFEFEPNQMRVMVGRHDMDKQSEEGAVIMAIEKKIVSPGFDGNTIPDVDVGLLIVTQAIQWGPYVKPICMWTSSTDLGNGREDGKVVGWGKDENGVRTRFPKVVTVRTETTDVCRSKNLWANSYLTPRTICAKNNQGGGPCIGDSGGPLMIQRHNRWLVRGIVSIASRIGTNCNLKNHVIYADISKHLHWIEPNIVR